MSADNIERAKIALAGANAVLSSNGRANGDHHPNETPAGEEHSWQPIDLIANDLDPPPPPTISGLVYPGRRHVFSGEPEALKSWAALILCAEQIAQHQTVMYVDFEMGQQETLSRLRAVGLTDEQIQQHVIYLEPDEPFTDIRIETEVAAMIDARHVTLVIIDAFTGALQTHGLKPNESIDIETFYRRVADPLRQHGAGIVILDHLAKDPATRGKFSIGSERKVGACEVHLGFDVITPFGRGRIGRAKITVHKDRPGYMPRPKLGELELSSDAVTGRITWRIERATGDEDPRDFRPTILMQRISEHLEEQPEPVSKHSVELAIKGAANGVRIAIGTLLRERYIEHIPGPRGAHLLASVMPYREASDPVIHPTSSTSSDLVSTSSNPGGRTTSSTSSPPYKGDEFVPDELDGVNSPDLVLVDHERPPLDDTLQPHDTTPPTDLDQLHPTNEGWDA